MILADWQIRDLVYDTGMISPFYDHLVRALNDQRVVSFGLSSFGYDVRLSANGLRMFSSRQALGAIDVKRTDQLDSSAQGELVDVSAQGKLVDVDEHYILPPRAYALGVTVEMFDLPRDITGICVGKSTYARAGLIVNTTPIEAGWRGRLVVELSNATNLPLKVYANEGIAQIQFYRGAACQVSYADRDGKYQNQNGVTLARV